MSFDTSMAMATASIASTTAMKAVYDQRARWLAIQKRRTPPIPITIANDERTMLTGASSVSSSPKNGATIGINRYVMVHRMPETTIAVFVDRRAPKIAFLSTTSPTRSSRRTNRSPGGRSGWRSWAKLIGAS